MKKISMALCCFALVVSGMAQNLKTFTLTMQPGLVSNNSYISLKKQKLFNEQDAGDVKASIDFLYKVEVAGKDTLREFINMSNNTETVPKLLQGTDTKIVALSWDIDLWKKCRTSADLKRMAGYMTDNSFSFHAEIANNHVGDINYPFFIFQTAAGKRGVIYVERKSDGVINMTVKKED